MKTKPCHDRQMIEVQYDNDCDNLTLEQAEKFHKELEGAIYKLKNRKKPEGPAPLTYGDVGHGGEYSKEKESDEFAFCGPRETKYKPYFSVGGFEFDLEGIKKLNQWTSEALKYHGVK